MGMKTLRPSHLLPSKSVLKTCRYVSHLGRTKSH